MLVTVRIKGKNKPAGLSFVKSILKWIETERMGKCKVKLVWTTCWQSDLAWYWVTFAKHQLPLNTSFGTQKYELLHILLWFFSIMHVAATYSLWSDLRLGHTEKWFIGLLRVFYTCFKWLNITLTWLKDLFSKVWKDVFLQVFTLLLSLSDL